MDFSFKEHKFLKGTFYFILTIIVLSYFLLKTKTKLSLPTCIYR